MKTDPNSTMFPITSQVSKEYKGLTKREYFAGLAMSGLMANNTVINTDGNMVVGKSILAELAVISAEALIKELNKEQA